MCSSCTSGTEAGVDQTMLTRRENLTHVLWGSPCDPVPYLQRAKVHSELGYFDLAAGDAYLALCLLKDDGSAGSKQPEAVVSLHCYHELPEDLRCKDLSHTGHHDPVRSVSTCCLHVLSISLMLCGDLQAADFFCQQGLSESPNTRDLADANDHIELAKKRFGQGHVPEWGVVRREIYPWNTHQPECTSRGRESQASALDYDFQDLDLRNDKEGDASACFALLEDLIDRAEREELHLLELPEIKFLSGDFIDSDKNAIDTSPNGRPPPPWTLPFSFEYNIRRPLELLRHRGIDVHKRLVDWDPWIFNVYYAKTMTNAIVRESLRQGLSNPTYAYHFDHHHQDSHPQERARTSFDRAPSFSVYGAPGGAECSKRLDVLMGESKAKTITEWMDGMKDSMLASKDTLEP